MAEAKKKCRQYSIDYLKFGFIPSLLDKRLPICLLCNRVLNNYAMKPSKLEENLRRFHPDKIDKDLTYFKTLKENLPKRITCAVCSLQHQKETMMICRCLTISHESQLIAKQENLILSGKS
ncbi:hypothetical protein JRQ81_016327 [Phrynocephalus forsythii]|uniref:Uncharacterized protein n=1 Tax=Phrynocephalus forsythii TaxID=171643 RepID=A0A9Q1B2X4_9SAUR|nr:hypothetical protein JRQ81_016327 [Phrynocephalus forsythii]